MTFKCLYKNSSFIFNGAKIDVEGDIIQTDNAEMIEFLKQNVNFEVIDEPKKGK